MYCAAITKEMKHWALSLLILMTLKINGDLKTRGVANRRKQRLYADESECSSPTPDFCAFKCVCGVIVKERRDVATSDLLGFFLQIDREREELIILKLTGAIVLLLVESDENK